MSESFPNLASARLMAYSPSVSGNQLPWKNQANRGVNVSSPQKTDMVGGNAPQSIGRLLDMHQYLRRPVDTSDGFRRTGQEILPRKKHALDFLGAFIPFRGRLDIEGRVGK